MPTADLLTTRQLQELLQIDRITIYRMLSDGRLTGFKVGGQWRFSRQEIEKWLQEQRATLDVGEAPGETGELRPAARVLPLSCIQAVQSIYAEALGVAAVTVDVDGSLLTKISHSCLFCNLILATEEGRRRCAASWKPLAGSGSSPPQLRSCHAGLLCASVPVRVEGEWVASVATCQFVGQAAESTGSAWRSNLPALAADLGLAEDELQAAAEKVRALPQDQLARVSRLLWQVANTFCEFGQERQKMLDRFQRIAEMTNV